MIRQSHPLAGRCVLHDVKFSSVLKGISLTDHAHCGGGWINAGASRSLIYYLMPPQGFFD